MQREPLRERARGRWQGILPAVGVSSKYLSGKHGPCPICRDGKDRFRFDNKDGTGTYICNSCGAGDGVRLVMETQGFDFKQAAARIEEHIGSAPVIKTRPGLTPAQSRQANIALWKQSQPVRPHDPVWRYLKNRCGDVPISEELRYVRQCRYYDENGSTYHPAMLALLRDAEGTAVSLHRTYITMVGQKANVESARRLMPGSIPAGSAVRLSEATETLGIAEGIETALSASKLFRVPVWAALNATLLAKWQPPKGVLRVRIFADNDESFTGTHAAHELAKRLVRDGLRVTVEPPDMVGQDWNDVLNERELRSA